MAVVGTSQYELLTVTIASALAGAVFGDHVSPISDTTILSSAGAECQHLDHVGTQIPYALTVAACSFVGFLVAGFTLNWILSLAVGIVLLAAILGFFYLREKKGAKA